MSQGAMPDQGMLPTLILLVLMTGLDCMCAPFIAGCHPYLPPPAELQEGAGCDVCLGDLECMGPEPALCNGTRTACTGAVARDGRLPVCTYPQGVCNGLNACGDPPWPPN